ncbi:hypothetical protein CLPU_1c00150 [Gottschalkia purinilytica]|uniref:Uncharacterized protein n=1 Tax=Gottschalkia purinilytica TaxID=1503 RepID=A0A0L0WEJ9_GOTPU|nr:hypothetical protein [Gottschalkia purinilytica]KNF09850.1 hypothetical protein CLPU_1c00150 [Gottschalkia purinilytica]
MAMKKEKEIKIVILNPEAIPNAKRAFTEAVLKAYNEKQIQQAQEEQAK